MVDTDATTKDSDMMQAGMDTREEKVSVTPIPIWHRGAGNCYVGIHQYFFFATMLDPCIAPMLPEMMTPVDYDLLNSDIVGAVLVQAKVANVIAPANPTRPTENSNSEETPEPAGTPKKAKRANKMNKMFRGLNTTGASPTANPIAERDENLRLLCRAELEHYLS